MKNYQILISDLDDALIKTISGETFPKGVWDMQFRFDVLDKIKELHPQYVLIASNQCGIEKGFVDEGNFIVKAEYIKRSIEEYCGCKCHYTFCPRNDSYDRDRKPNPGMIVHLIEWRIGLDSKSVRSDCLMIGDASGKPGQFSDTDKKIAENFGCNYMDVEDFINYENN